MNINIDLSALDTFLKNRRRALLLPGLAVAVVQEGRVAHLCAQGLAAPGRAMTTETPLIIGSLSKSFTALAVLQLVEAGKLELDAPVQHYVPWFRLEDSEGAAAITVKHLLTHTSGISRYDGRALLAGRGGQTIEQSVRTLRGLRLSQPVGAAFQYSNINYLIAGLIVEVVSGQPFAAYIQQHILTPLSMEHSYTSEEAARRGGLASGYRWWFGVPVPFRAPFLDDALPAAYIAASVADLARYALALLDGSPVLSPSGVAALFGSQVAAASGSAYALGWRVEQLAGVPIVRHGGEVSNFLTEVVLLPEHGAAVVVLMNAGNGLIPMAVKDASRLGSDLVLRFLLGVSQPRRLSLVGFYALLNTVLAALSLCQVWSMLRLLRSNSVRQGRSVLMLAAVVEVMLAAVGLRTIPRIADSPWRLLRMYVPDVTSWLAAFSCGSLFKALVVLLRLFRVP